MKLLDLLAATLCVVASSFASDCSVCLHGRCHGLSLFYGNFNRLRSGRMVIDYNSNIIYLCDDGIDVIHLDAQTMSTLPMVSTGHRVAMDHDTGDVYYYRNCKFNNIYKYQPKINTTDVISVSVNRPPLSLFVHNSTIYFNSHKENGYEFENGLNFLNNTTVERISALENVTVNDLKFDKFGSMYINTGSEIYRLKKNEEKPNLLFEGKYLLSEDRNGEIYFFETAKRFFYKINLDKDVLISIGAYDDSVDGKRPKMQNFWFDRDNNVIIKDNWSVMYYKRKEYSTECLFEFDEARNRTKITKVNVRN